MNAQSELVLKFELAFLSPRRALHNILSNAFTRMAFSMRFSRKPLVQLLLAMGALSSGQSFAQVSGTATTSVTVNFPDILVLYTFSDIDLTLDATFIGGQFGLTPAVACTDPIGNSYCVNAGSVTEIGVTATTDLDIANSGIDEDGNLTSATLTLDNAFGARSLGLEDASYTLAVTDQGDTDVLGIDTDTQATSFTNSGLALSTGSLVLSIDPTEIDTQGESVQVIENFDITVSGT